MSSILTEQLPIGLAEWIKQNIYYEGMIVTVNDYPRLDNPVLEMTTCNVWLNNMDFKTIQILKQCCCFDQAIQILCNTDISQKDKIKSFVRHIEILL